MDMEIAHNKNSHNGRFMGILSNNLLTMGGGEAQTRCSSMAWLLKALPPIVNSIFVVHYEKLALNSA
jgi:hypothetical protein